MKAGRLVVPSRYAAWRVYILPITASRLCPHPATCPPSYIALHLQTTWCAALATSLEGKPHFVITGGQAATTTLLEGKLPRLHYWRASCPATLQKGKLPLLHCWRASWPCLTAEGKLPLLHCWGASVTLEGELPRYTLLGKLPRYTASWQATLLESKLPMPPCWWAGCPCVIAGGQAVPASLLEGSLPLLNYGRTSCHRDGAAKG